jgi:hypothetical protein
MLLLPSLVPMFGGRMEKSIGPVANEDGHAGGGDDDDVGVGVDAVDGGYDNLALENSTKQVRASDDGAAVGDGGSTSDDDPSGDDDDHDDDDPSPDDDAPPSPGTTR